MWGYLTSVYGNNTLTGLAASSHQGGTFGDVFSFSGKTPAVAGYEFSDWAGSVISTAAINGIIANYDAYHPIVQFQWHWMLNGQSAWANQRTTPVNVANCTTPGTTEYNAVMTDLNLVANDIQVLQNHNIPIIFRPLHEIDGGWFWWTDASNPANTVNLYKLIYNYMTNTRGLNNIIWDWSSGCGSGLPPTSATNNFYPGSQYVDIIGADPYGRNFADDNVYFNSLWNALSSIDSTKMLALAECGAVPNASLMQQSVTPKWLYCLTWYGIAQDQYSSFTADVANWQNP
ncbi:MAG: glycosyl hydrolase, partial [Phycisphaerae bacterium]